jgi:hypothetical protein
MVSTTTVKIKSTGLALTAFYGSSVFTAALASGDFISYSGSYEAAADA